MAQRRALFDLPFSLPKAVPLLLLALFIVLICAPFFSSYLRNTFAPNDRYPLTGDWVGIVTVRPAAAIAANPLPGSGNSVMRVTVRPVLFSYLSRLTGAGSLTDAHGQTTGFQLRPFRQPYLRDQVAIQADTVGSRDGLTGSWNRVELAGNTLTVYNATAGNNQTVTGVLQRGDALTYRKMVEQLAESHAEGRVGR